MLRAAIDIGNTRIKCALFDIEGQILEKGAFTLIPEVTEWLSKNKAESVMVSSVGRYKLPDIKGVSIYNLSYATNTPFTNLYTTPETLGVDRIAAMAAACSIYPDTPVLVFDIGTCMTIDLMEAGKIYRGGNISPGLQMRLKAMHTMTDKLPYASLQDISGLAGIHTKNALANGAFLGMKYEIEGYIAHYLAQYPDLFTVICGGDFSHFDKQLKYKIFAAPDFVLQGLYHLLLLNEK